jgi:hypothetical protein
VVAFCGSFRGNEVLLTNLFGLSKYLAELSNKPFIMIPLLGKYKGESHYRYHLTPMAAQTDPGIQVRTWVSRLVQVQHEAGRSHGPAFRDRYGEMLNSSFIKDLVSDCLQMVRNSRPGLIPNEVDCYEDFGISRVTL